MIWLLRNRRESRDGYSVVADGLECAFRKQGLEIEVVYANNGLADLFGLHSLRKNGRWILSAYFDSLILFGRIIFSHKRKPTYMVACCEVYAEACKNIKTLLKVRYGIIVQGTYGVVLPRYRLSFRIAFEQADNLFFGSPYTLDQVKKNTVLSLKNAVVVGNGYDPSTFYYKGLMREPAVLFVGNGKRRKGFNQLVKGLACLRTRSNIRPQLWIVGSKKSFSKEQIRNSHEACDVTFFENISDQKLCDLYNSAALNVLISCKDGDYFEGFGLIHLEAIACRTFTVGGIESANSFVIGNNRKVGIVIEAENAQGLVEILEDRISRPRPVHGIHQPDLSVRTWSQIATKYFNEIL